MSRLIIKLIKFYQYCIGPFSPPSCRFSPTCSNYASEALRKYGFIKGMALSIGRVLRCHPWNRGGYDPVP
ncbi:MAG: membrane protein insertion efficiency factor YidD [Nitrosomonas sp.]|nr:membrane protein insertion efficiency factor YidD [Nitrosomonas sp.]